MVLEEEGEVLIRRGNRRELYNDRFNMIYFIFFFLGIATLLPWNCFITAISFFQYKLRNMTIPPGNNSDPTTHTQLQLMYENYLVVSASSASIVFMFINLFLTKCVNRTRRFLLGSSMLIVTFSIIIALAVIDTSSFQTVFFFISISLGCLANGGSAFTQGSVIGLAGMFPEKYTKATMEGQALGGIIAAVSNIITLYLASNPLNSGLFYFIIALCIILISVVLFLCLPHMTYAKYYMDTDDARMVSTVNCEEDDVNNFSSVSSEEPLITQSTMSCEEEPSILDVLWKVKFDAYSLVLTFFITLSIFPSILAKIRPMQMDINDPWKNTFFTPVLCFLFFNIGDYFGRFLIGLLGVVGHRFYWLHHVLVLLRLVFFPLILFCNIQPRSHHSIPVLFKSDVFPGAFSVLLGISNGYLATSSLILAVSSVRESCLELTGNVMSLFLIIGIAFGGFFSLALVMII